MQKVFSTIVFSILAISVMAQNSASTKSANIYLNASYLNQSVSVNLKAGINKILVDNVSYKDGFQSFSIQKQDGFEFISAKAKTDYTERMIANPEFERLENKLNNTKQKLNLYKERKRFFKEEEELFLQQKNLLGANSKLLLEDVLEMGDIYRNRLPYIAKQMLLLQDSIAYFTVEVKRWEESLKQLNDFEPFATYLELVLNCQRPGSYNLNFGYLVKSIQWQPEYRIESQSGKDALQVELNAKVQQNSGIDLENVSLSFISSRYINQQYLNELNSIYADYGSENKYINGVSIRGARTNDANYIQSSADNVLYENEVYNDVQSEAMRSFKSSANVSIANNNSNFNVTLTKNSVNAKKYYLARPELSIYGYLQAEVENFKNYFPIATNAELWIDNTLNGKTYIDPSTSEDVLKVNLGQDQQISLSRNTTSDKDKDANLISASKKVKSYKIKVNSGKPFPVVVKVEDRYPKSKNESIEVELNGTSSADNNADKGILTWELELDGNQNKEISWGYTIKYDGKEDLQIR